VKILAIDIETSPLITYTWGLWDQNIGINQIQEDTRIICFAARWLDAPKKEIVFWSEFHDGHPEMVQEAHALIDEADAVLSWNGRSFDTKHLNREFLLAGLGPPSPVKEIDLMAASKRVFRWPSNKLDYVAQQLGVGKKVSHEGFGLWLACLDGDPAAWTRMQRYNEQDVHLLIDLYRKLVGWIPSHPNRLLFGGTGCPKCGSGPLIKRGLRPGLNGLYQRYQCKACRGYSTEGKAIERTEIRGE
jgi:hypothetical protein